MGDKQGEGFDLRDERDSEVNIQEHLAHRSCSSSSVFYISHQSVRKKENCTSRVSQVEAKSVYCVDSGGKIFLPRG